MDLKEDRKTYYASVTLDGKLRENFCAFFLALWKIMLYMYI